MAKMDDCLKKAADARRLSISLGNLAYGGEVSKELLDFSTKMEKVYRNLQKMVNDKSTEESKFTGLLAIINEKMEWFTKAEARFGNHCYFCVGYNGVFLNQKRNNIGIQNVLRSSYTCSTKPLASYTILFFNLTLFSRLLQKVCRKVWMHPSQRRKARKTKMKMKRRTRRRLRHDEAARQTAWRLVLFHGL